MYLYELETVSKVVCYWRGEVSLWTLAESLKKKKEKCCWGSVEGGVSDPRSILTNFHLILAEA